MDQNNDRTIKEIAEALGVDNSKIKYTDVLELSFTDNGNVYNAYTIQGIDTLKIKNYDIFEKYNIIIKEASYINNFKVVNANNIKKLTFEDCTIKNIDFSHSQIDDIEFNRCAIEQMSFFNIKFNNFKIEEIKSNEYIKISSCTFSGDFQIINSSIKNINQGIVLQSQKNKFFKKAMIITKSQIDNLDLSNSEFYSEVDFNNCTFKNINLGKTIIKNITNFKNCEFVRVYFENTIFEDNAYFNNANFKDFADFHESEFRGTACFYGVEFCKTPNFSSVLFAKNAILINTSFHSNNFKKIKKDCDKEADRRWENNNKDTANKEKQEFYKKVYSDFRNSFAILKHTLNNSGNLIDASNHHKAELYCKEMELECDLLGAINYSKQQYSTKRNTNKNEINITLFFKFIYSILKGAGKFLLSLICYIIFFVLCILTLPAFIIAFETCGLLWVFYRTIKYLFSTEKCIWKKQIVKINRKKIDDFTKWFDYLTLNIYRNTSDHHTNFNKIFHFTLLMIAAYGTCLFCINKVSEFIVKSFSYEIYLTLNILLILLLMFVSIFKYKEITKYGMSAIVFLCLIFTVFTILLQNKSHIIFGILLYIFVLIISYILFISKGSVVIISTRLFAYIALILILLLRPELINPTQNIINKENIENKNLLEKFTDLSDRDLAILTKLSFRDYDNNASISFSENNIVNQKEIIIANKKTLESIFKFLFVKTDKDSLLKILEEVDNKIDLNTILREPKNRTIALNLIFAANKEYERNLYDMELKDSFRLFFKFADEKEIQREINLLLDAIAEDNNTLQKLQPIIEKQEVYLDVYIAIRIDEINSQTYKSTYILYFIIMILCLYSLTKTARKNSVIS